MLISGRHIFSNCTCNNLFAIPPLCLGVINAAVNPGEKSRGLRQTREVAFLWTKMCLCGSRHRHRRRPSVTRLPGIVSTSGVRVYLFDFVRFVTFWYFNEFQLQKKPRLKVCSHQKFMKRLLLAAFPSESFDVSPAELNARVPRDCQYPSIFSALDFGQRQWPNMQIC